MFSNENRMENNANNSKRRNYRKNVQDSSHSSEIFQINSHLLEKCVYADDDDPPNYTCYIIYPPWDNDDVSLCVRTITSRRRRRRARECRQSFSTEGPFKNPRPSSSPFLIDSLFLHSYLYVLWVGYRIYRDDDDHGN